MDASTSHENQQVSFDLKQEIFKYLPFWYWFVIGIVIAFMGVSLYLRYQSNVYQSKTIIKLLDDSNSDFKMPTSGVNFFMRSKINIENEKEIIKSNRLIGQVVHELQLYNQFFSEGKIRIAEEYGNTIPSIEWIGDQQKVDEFSGFWNINYDSKGYVWNEDGKKRSYGVVYDVDNIAMKVNAPIVLHKNKRTLQVKKSSFEDAVVRLKANIDVNLVGEESELLAISTKGPLIEKNNAILNTLNEVFDRDGREDRQRVFKKTIDFVNSRFEYLFKELDTIELNKANYKRDQKLSFLEGDAGTLLATKTESFSQYEKAKTQSMLSEIIIAALREVKDNELLPANIGLEEMKVNSLIEEYNKVVLEAQKTITNGGEKHPSVGKLLAIQQNLKSSIKYSLLAYQKVLATNIQSIEQIKAQQENQYAAIPYQEKTIRAIERQQKIKETLYLLLLQKREEASINLAIVNPSIKIVDEAIADKNPLSPKRGVAFLLAFSLGLLIPFGILFVYYLFDTKIHTKEMIQRGLPTVPILAEIPFIESNSKIVHKNEHTVLSESFRILVANLDFVFPVQLTKSPIIYTASTIKGEGKTFVATNLALSLAALGKKVILVGTDLRNPQLHKALNSKKAKLGLVDLLVNSEIATHSCIVQEAINDISLDVIYSGVIPPNPTEILSNGKLGQLLEELRTKYDYVLVDTAPTLLVADTTIISKYADIVLYLIKANYTDKQLMSYITDLKDQSKIANPFIVFNNVGQNEGYGKGYAYSYQYNYGYGYGYGVNPKYLSRFEKIKSFVKQIVKKR
ncbi:GumC family protein [Flavobacterium cyclinae]|uniref:GumC family protein n=1 Tax=Flavobacterium cyclinae TaxID=2895947 RepID=UPI001E473859|nr:polysaccharide biosynthesis tyrosine autokinase [Flavobacterium cyclinae]UGS20575.1 polysaccharide biosynthesis tyrosine autokinase [Flavobacterium cyclinae]